MVKKKKSKSTKSEHLVLEITRSFSRKLNMTAHGGKQYETADILCSITAKTADALTTSKELDTLCRKEVESTIKRIDDLALDEDVAVTPKKKKKVLDVGVKVEQEEMEEIQEYINDLTVASDLDELKAAVLKIKKETSSFNQRQKKYLTAYYLKRKDALV